MIKITCPNCGAEYLPAEIFYPDNFLGNPKHISKTKQGKIEFYSGYNMNLKETYICDYCKRKMTVKSSINFSVEIPQLENTHITKFKTSSLKLDEK